MSKMAVLLIAHGSPERVEDIPEFLQNISRGRPMADSVVREVQHRYSLIGSSPLTRITRQQAQNVAGELGIPVYVGMRNWHPFIADTLKQMASDNVGQAVAICLAPHNSRTSVGAYKESLFGENAAFPIDFVEEWHDHPLLIEAFAEKLRAGWAKACEEHGSRLPVLFTAHSVPMRTITEGDPYEAQTRETAALVAKQVPEIGEWKFAFQSQGMSGGEWLGPTVEDTITSLQSEGCTGIFLQPIGFVCDHVEILFDIDILFRQFAAERGMKLYRAESLNDSPTFAKAVADLVRTRLNAGPPCAGSLAAEKMQ
ncbi:MAG TPA: ferrochelatase [Candidatus Limnocylindrales bacterium]|nr:ferrochelatase [Candidatus Limnocylindrales bacterium]